MSRSHRPRKYRHYKPKNLAVVRLDGRDHYLGAYDSPESWEKHHRLIAEHLSGQSSSGGQPPAGQSGVDGSLTLEQLLLRYWKFAESYYQVDGEPTKELACMRDALRPLRRLYGSLAAPEFGPLKLKVVRDYMIDEQDLCRNEINKRVGRIKRFFGWAVSEELVPPSVMQGLPTVAGLRKNKSRRAGQRRRRGVRIVAQRPCAEA